MSSNFLLVFFISLLTLSMTTVSQSDQLLGGKSSIDLTPPLEMKASLGGYGERMNKPATGVHDRVWVKCLIFKKSDTENVNPKNASKSIAIVTADILGFPVGFKNEVLRRLSTPRWKDDQIILLPSHSHTSIDISAINPSNTFTIPQLGIFSRPLYEHTVNCVVSAIQHAEQDLQPVRIGTNSITLTGWNTNRRAGNTITDTELTVTRIDLASRKPFAALVNWTAHPTFAGPDEMFFSGDWPGHLQRTLEALVGNDLQAMYYNGAEGDQTKVARRSGDSSWEQAERYGSELGIQVWKVYQQIKPSAKAELSSRSIEIVLPPAQAHPDFMETGGKEYGLNESNIMEILKATSPSATHSQSVHVGDLLIVGVPGELTAELGLEVKNRVRTSTGIKHVVIGGLADEWTGYILSAQEYTKRSGYEASMSFHGPNLGRTIVEGVVHGAERK